MDPSQFYTMDTSIHSINETNLNNPSSLQTPVDKQFQYRGLQPIPYQPLQQPHAHVSAALSNQTSFNPHFNPHISTRQNVLIPNPPVHDGYVIQPPSDHLPTENSMECGVENVCFIPQYPPILQQTVMMTTVPQSGLVHDPSHALVPQQSMVIGHPVRANLSEYSTPRFSHGWPQTALPLQSSFFPFFQQEGPTEPKLPFPQQSMVPDKTNAQEVRHKGLYPKQPDISMAVKQHSNFIPYAGGSRQLKSMPFDPANNSGQGNFAFHYPLSPSSVYSNFSNRPTTTSDTPMEFEMQHSMLAQVSGDPLPMELSQQSSCVEEPSILNVKVRLAEGTKTLKDLVIEFMSSTYFSLRTKTYRVPQKPPVNQKHPDKALVRAREGEYRVSLALERLSQDGKGPMFLLSDYRYENFFKKLGNKVILSDDQTGIAKKLEQFLASKLFGDFDLLMFHSDHGVFVLSLCCVGSNSDVQYILRRLQKSRQQLDKSVGEMGKALSFLGIDATVVGIFCTPNLKRVFLNRVIGRDKTLYKSLSGISTLCADELPIQFKSEWMSSEHYELLSQWWSKVIEDRKVKGFGVNQLEIIIGSFLCSEVSQVDFEQSKDLNPNQEKGSNIEYKSQQDEGSGKERTEKVETDLSTLQLTIGNVTKPFTKYMEEYVDYYYPDFLTKTYRVPPVHFNIQKITRRNDIAYDILELPMSKDTRGDEGENRVVSAIEILGLKYREVKPVFIICDFQYNNYLNKLKETMFVKGDDRRPQRAYGQSVRAQHDCLLIHKDYGIIIISVKAVGDNFKEWASNGFEQWTAVKRTLDKVLKQLPREEQMVSLVLSDLTRAIPCHKLIALPNLFRQDVDKAISDDLGLQEKIRELFPDKGTSAFLCKDELCENTESIWEAYEKNPSFYNNLCQWWDRAVGPKTPGVLSEALCKQIIGRFCGLLSTIEVWSMHAPRTEIRSKAEAIAETGERYHKILLTPEQVSILSMTLKRLFLTGPPGGGKTLLLLLKAAQWVEKKGHVVILNLHAGSKGLPLGHQFEKQLRHLISTSQAEKRGNLAKLSASHSSDLPMEQDTTAELEVTSLSSKDDVKNLSPSEDSDGQILSTASSLPSLASPQLLPTNSSCLSSSASSPVPIQRIDYDTLKDTPESLADIPLNACLIIDEIKRSSHSTIDWLIDNRKPEFVWCAGQFSDSCPKGFEERTLNLILRCTPMVQRVLQNTFDELGQQKKWSTYSQTLILSSASHGLVTDGSRPLIIFHSKHNSPASLPQDCKQCGLDLADIFINDLNLPSALATEHFRSRKPSPQPASGSISHLQWKDVVLVCRTAFSCALVTAMRKKGIPITIIQDTANPQVAVPTKDEIIFTTPFAMTGLERKVVVYIPFQSRDPLASQYDLAEDGEGEQSSVKSSLDDLKVGQALRELTEEDKVALWYTASRCLSQFILFIP